MKVLEVKDLHYFYQDGTRKRVILDKVNADFETGKFYSILGESGSGKTTFLSTISALDTPKEGKILFRGKDIREIGYEKYRRNNISIVFQNYNLIQYMTAMENVLTAMEITDNEIKGNKKKLAYQFLEDVEIDRETADRRVSRLSGGEQQRTAIARALSTNVDIILADEPTGNLDHETSEGIIELLIKLAHEKNKCVIIVTHDLNIADKSDVVLSLDPKARNFIRKDNNIVRKQVESEFYEV